jgi:hypothetical protein
VYVSVCLELLFSLFVLCVKNEKGSMFGRNFLSVFVTKSELPFPRLHFVLEGVSKYLNPDLLN